MSTICGAVAAHAVNMSCTWKRKLTGHERARSGSNVGIRARARKKEQHGKLHVEERKAGQSGGEEAAGSRVCMRERASGRLRAPPQRGDAQVPPRRSILIEKIMIIKDLILGVWERARQSHSCAFTLRRRTLRAAVLRAGSGASSSLHSSATVGKLCLGGTATSSEQ